MIKKRYTAAYSFLVFGTLSIFQGITLYKGHTQKNGAVLIVNTIKTASFFCVGPVYRSITVTADVGTKLRLVPSVWYQKIGYCSLLTPSIFKLLL